MLLAHFLNPPPAPPVTPGPHKRDRVRLWRPGHAHHGMAGVVERVHDGEVWTGGGWSAGRFVLHDPAPVHQVVTEDEYQARKRRHRWGWCWPR